MSSALSALNITTEVPLSKASNPQLLPVRRSKKCLPTAPGVCSLLCVCALDGINAEHKFRVWVTILGHMSLSVITLGFIHHKQYCTLETDEVILCVLTMSTCSSVVSSMHVVKK